MKFFKPAWVGHDGNPIFSIDIHPDGSRFATGGQGPEKCGRVIIWNMAPIISTKDEEKKDVPKKLCQMDNHLACINCVRWSNHGKYLASAGDDKNLMVWQLAGRNYNHTPVRQAQSSVFESANLEQWRCIATLNGHNGDILDLAWSANDDHLASCSVDNMIIVWDANNFPQMITKITGHTGLVKGVACDPAGKYLASQSDDKTVRIWRTSDWGEETVIKKPFKECGGTTHVLRLNWSPDGQTLVSAHAMNNCGSVAQIIERDGWKTQRDLVGHRKAVTCVRFNPNLLQTYSKPKKQAEKNSTPNTNSAANTNNNTNINNSNNNDNNNSGGANIVATNGTSLLAGANNNKPSSVANKAVKYCCMAVGSRDRSISIWLTNQPRPLIVTHDLFESSVLDISWSRDGYRLLACSQDGTVAAMVFSASEIGQKLTKDERQAHFQKLYGKSITSNPTTSKTIVAEDPELIGAQVEQQKQKVNREMLDQLSSHSNSISQNGYNGCESNTSLSGMSKGPTDRQIETLLPGGKRRITPLYIQPSIPFNSTSSITFSSSKEAKTKIVIETTTSTPLPATPTPNFNQTTPTKSNQNHASSTNIVKSIRKEQIIPATQQKTLAPSKLDKATVFKVKSLEGKKFVLEAENDTNSEKLNELRLMDETNSKVWDVLLSSRINSVIATPMLAAASCVDSSLHLFELRSGRRLVPPIVLDSPVAHIAAEGSHVLIITACANMWLWNLDQNKVLVKGESVSSILVSQTNSTTVSEKPASQAAGKSSGKGGDRIAKSGTSGDDLQTSGQHDQSDIEILSCSLTTNHQPLVLLSTGRAFIFDHNLHCWLLISDTNDSITRWSSCKPSLTAMKRFLMQKKVDAAGESSSMGKSLPLASLQSQHSFDIKRFASLINKSGSESLQVKATRSYLDQQLASALAIKSAHEYHYWLLQSVQHYVDTGAESRLKDLCSRLAASAFGTSRSFDDIDLLDHNCLLREVLAILSRDLRYQRIYSEYKQMLDYKADGE